MRRECKMKLRYAAALVLSGWLLMTPPPMKNSPDVFDVTAPFSQWLVWSETGSEFASQRECEDSRRKQCVDWLFNRGSPVSWMYDCYNRARVAVCASVCLPDNDPRLAPDPRSRHSPTIKNSISPNP